MTSTIIVEEPKGKFWITSEELELLIFSENEMLATLSDSLTILVGSGLKENK
jgi:hypothetical protein